MDEPFLSRRVMQNMLLGLGVVVASSTLIGWTFNRFLSRKNKLYRNF
jgi:hypothetical protein